VPPHLFAETCPAFWLNGTHGVSSADAVFFCSSTVRNLLIRSFEPISTPHEGQRVGTQLPPHRRSGSEIGGGGGAGTGLPEVAPTQHSCGIFPHVRRLYAADPPPAESADRAVWRLWSKLDVPPCLFCMCSLQSFFDSFAGFHFWGCSFFCSLDIFFYVGTPPMSSQKPAGDLTEAPASPLGMCPVGAI